MSVAPVSSVPPARVTIGVEVSFPSGFTPFSLTSPTSVFVRSLCRLLGRLPRLHGSYWLWLPLGFEEVIVSSLVLLLISSRVVIAVERSFLIFAGILVVNNLVVNRATWPAHFVIWRFWRFSTV